MMSITNTTDPVLNRQFEQIVECWDGTPHCEMATQAGHQCRQRAHWRLDLHGCEQALLCGQHLRAWQRAADETSTGRCAHCGHQFAQVSDSYSATPL